MFFTQEKDFADYTGCAGGLEWSFMHRSHKRITNYATKPLKFLPFCFPTQGALSHTLGSSGREWGSPLLEAHQMRKLGHSTPSGSQAPPPVEVSTLVHLRTKRWHLEPRCWCFCWLKSGVWDFESVSGIPQTNRKELRTFIISLYILKALFASLRVFFWLFLVGVGGGRV